jgi:large subunit ribosomal protein L23
MGAGGIGGVVAATLTEVGAAVTAVSTNPDIRTAVELMFPVKVAAVQVVNEPGKTRRFGKTPGRTQDWKKACVRLAAGQSIDFEARPAANP